MQDKRYTLTVRLIAILLIVVGVIAGLGVGPGVSAAAAFGLLTPQIALLLLPSLCLLFAGGFLLSGSPRAAAYVRWLALFFLGALASLLLLTPVDIPLGYMLAELRLKPEAYLETAIYLLPLFLFLLLVIFGLGREPVVAACKAAGVAMRAPLHAIAWGAGVALVAVLAQSFLLDRQDFDRAKDLAFEQLGPDYRYYVKSFGYDSETTGDASGAPPVTVNFKSATVDAWNDSEIRSVKVRWPEK